jgi:hypothetical protein
MKYSFFTRILVLLTAITCVPRLQAATFASDTAANSAYDDGWQTGDNGGIGWGGGWELFPGGGHFVASSTTNGIGDPGLDGDIDTQGRSWGMLTGLPTSNNHSANYAIRPFDGTLSLDQQFVIDVDPGPSGGFGSGYSGFALRDSGTNERFRFYVSFGAVFIQDTNIGVSSTDQGFHVVFTLTGTDSYSVSTYGVGSDGPSGLPVTLSGSLFVPNGTALMDVKLFAVDTGPDVVNWQFFNSMAIIPEPSTFALVAMGVAALTLRRRKNSC